VNISHRTLLPTEFTGLVIPQLILRPKHKTMGVQFFSPILRMTLRVLDIVPLRQKTRKFSTANGIFKSTTETLKQGSSLRRFEPNIAGDYQRSPHQSNNYSMFSENVVGATMLQLKYLGRKLHACTDNSSHCMGCRLSNFTVVRIYQP